jgi:hypothetical protein
MDDAAEVIVSLYLRTASQRRGLSGSHADPPHRRWTSTFEELHELCLADEPPTAEMEKG